MKTGFYFLQSRYYDPEIGRFLSPDNQISTENVNNVNLFCYCNNNPINKTDPYGHFAQWIKSTIKTFFKKIIIPKYDSYKKRITASSRTRTVGITGNEAFGISGSYNAGITQDSRGDVALQITISSGAGTPNHSPVGVYYMTTNAPSYEDLNDMGFQCGGSVTIKSITFGGEYCCTLPNKTQSKSFGGVLFTASYSTDVPFWVEGHAEIGRTFSLRLFNIFDVCEDTFDAIESW